MSLFTGKAALLERIDQVAAGEDGVWLPKTSTPVDEIAAFNTRYGLYPAFAQLLIVLAEPLHWRQVIEALPEGVDTAVLARRWMAWVWSDPSSGLRSKITNMASGNACDAVFALHDRAATGEIVTRAEWRQARAAITATASEDEVEAAAASVAAAAAWDLDLVPGAAADMILAWRNTMFAEVDRQMQWNADKEAIVAARGDEAAAAGRTRAEAAVARGDAVGGDTPDARYIDAYTLGLHSFLAQNPSDLDRRAELRQGGYVEIYRLSRDALLDFVRQSGAVGKGGRLGLSFASRVKEGSRQT